MLVHNETDLRKYVREAVEAEREDIDEIADEESKKLLTNDKSLSYWHGVRATSTAFQVAIRARGEKTA